MADEPGSKHLDPQAAIAKHAAETQGSAGTDASIIQRVETQIQNSPMGMLQGLIGMVDSKHASESAAVHGKINESKDLIAKNSDPKDGKDGKDAKGAPSAPVAAAHGAAVASVDHHDVHPPAGAAPIDAAHKGPAAPGAQPAHGPTTGQAHDDNVDHAKDTRNAKDKGKEAPPALGTPTHVAVAHPAGNATASAPTQAGAPATSDAGDHKVAVAKPGLGGASPAAVDATHSITSALATVSGDAQIDAMLNAYAPKSEQSVEMLGRIKQMGDVAQGFNGQLDVYVARGGAIEHGIASAANFFNMGKDVSAVWSNNPYRKVGGLLGGLMTGLSAVKNVCSVVGNVCGKLGLVLTLVGLLGMIFPPIGVAVSGIARILNVIGLVCDGLSFVLTGILTGLNGVVLAKQMAAGASAEEKAATADLMMSEANDAATGVVSLAMAFGPGLAKGMLGNSKGVVNSLFRRAKSTIGRVSLKATGNISHFANKVVRKIGYGGAKAARVGDAWKDTGIIARTSESLANSKLGKLYYSAPRHIEGMQNYLMGKYGNTAWAKGMDRVGAWSGSVAHRYDYAEHLANQGESLGKRIGAIGSKRDYGKVMAEAADASERQTRELALKMDVRDASHLEGERWKNFYAEKPKDLRDKEMEQKLIKKNTQKVGADATKKFDSAEKQRDYIAAAEERRHERFERHNEEYLKNDSSKFSGEGKRDQVMGSVHGTRKTRFDMEKTYAAQETERKTLLAKTTRTAEEDTKLGVLNGELKPLDESRRVNQMFERELSGLAAGSERVRTPDYKDWKDINDNVKDAAEPVAEMLHWKEEDAAWEAAEKQGLNKQIKYSKKTAAGNSAARGGMGTLHDIEGDARRNQMASFSQFVRRPAPVSNVSGAVRSMLSNIGKRAPAAAKAPSAPAVSTKGPAAATKSTITQVKPPEPVTVTPAAASGGHDHGSAAVATATQEGPPGGASPAPAGGADQAGGEALPYWPSMLPEFDRAAHDFGWMRSVAVQFKKAQVTGKQQAVDTLAVYGRYQEYAKLRAASAEKNQQASKNTSQDAQQNVDHATQTQSQAGQGESKQNEAQSSANDRSATEIPEPESRGFWGRILGAVKRWAKAKAATLFGWLQNLIATCVLKALCNVSMGDMREYAGALRHQQMAAHSVADGAGKTSAQVQQQSIKLGSDSTKEAQGAVDAVGECDHNITDADGFMTDVASFEEQLMAERAHAQMFIAQIHASARTQQGQTASDSAQQDHDDRHAQQRTAQLGGDPEPAAEPAEPAEPVAAAEPAVDAAAAGAADAGAHEEPATDTTAASEIHSAAAYVAAEADAMGGRLESHAEDYHNQLAMAMTNRTGKDDQGHDLKKPAKQETKHIIDGFKQFAARTKHDLEAFQNMAIDPSSARKIADQIIQSAEHLESSFAESIDDLDRLYSVTYHHVQEGQHTLKNQLLDGDNVVGHINHLGNKASDQVIDKALPKANSMWAEVAAPIDMPSAPAAAPAPATATAPGTTES